MYSLEELILPVSVQQPCGEDLSFDASMDAINAARRQDDPTLEQGEWVTELRAADWRSVASQCMELVRTRSKDLRVAAWLAEALAHTHRFRGLGDGFALLASLCERYWEHVHPLPEGGDHELRTGNLSWLLARTPALVRGIPVTEDGSITQGDFDAARQRGGEEVAELDARRRRNSVQFNEALLQDAEYCLSALCSLQQAVDARLGVDGPSFGAARESLQNAIDFIGLLAPSASPQDCARGDAFRAGPGAAGVDACGAGHGAGGAGVRGAAHDAGGAVGWPGAAAAGGPGLPAVPATRAQAITQLRLVAEYFRRTEPHSPAAYLADKAAAWADMPLHEWLRAVVKDPGQQAHFDELLGAAPPA